jgi:hypothetical protein
LATALAITGKAVLFCASVIGGAMITLPSPNVSFAAQSPATSSVSEIDPPSAVSALVGLRGFDRAVAYQGADAVEVSNHVEEDPFGALQHVAFVEPPHSGTLIYGSETITLPFDPATDTYSFGPMKLKHELVKMIVHAAYLTGVDPRLLMAIADKESSFIVRARASTSSATGLFQFIDATWLRAIRDYGRRFGLEREAAMIQAGESGLFIADEQERQRVLNMRNDPFLSTLLAASMLRAEQEKLAGRLGRPISEAEVYLVHFLGPAGAQRFLSVLAEKPKTPAARLLPQAARANRPIFFAASKRKPQSLSVAQVHEKIGSSLERRLVRYRDLDFGPATAYAPVRSSEPRDNPFANWRL